jgi:hypothetical protein
MAGSRTISTYGVVAEFADAHDVLHAVHEARAAGYTVMEAYSPVPVHGLDEAIGRKRSKLPWIVFAAGLTGCVGGFFMQVWMAHIDYPWNVGGRPTLSWPAFIPVTFELTILSSALAAVFGMFGLNGLPRPHHPIFNTPNFDRSTLDHYFLCIEAEDPEFDEAKVTAFLENLKPEAVNTITDE